MAVRMWSKGQDRIIHTVFDPIDPRASWRDACRQPGLLAVVTSANTGSGGPPDNRAQLLVPVNPLWRIHASLSGIMRLVSIGAATQQRESLQTRTSANRVLGCPRVRNLRTTSTAGRSTARALLLKLREIGSVLLSVSVLAPSAGLAAGLLATAGSGACLCTLRELSVWSSREVQERAEEGMLQDNKRVGRFDGALFIHLRSKSVSWNSRQAVLLTGGGQAGDGFRECRAMCATPAYLGSRPGIRCLQLGIFALNPFSELAPC